MRFSHFCYFDWQEIHIGACVYWLRWLQRLGIEISLGPFHLEIALDWGPEDGNLLNG